MTLLLISTFVQQSRESFTNFFTWVTEVMEYMVNMASTQEMLIKPLTWEGLNAPIWKVVAAVYDEIHK